LRRLDYTHAFELAQSLRPDLQDILPNGKEIRIAEVQPILKRKDMICTWRMGVWEPAMYSLRVCMSS
jgi:hypothetical protein